MVRKKQRGLQVLIVFVLSLHAFFIDAQDSIQKSVSRDVGFLQKSGENSLVFNDPVTQELTVLFFDGSNARTDYQFNQRIKDSSDIQFKLAGNLLKTKWLSSKKVQLFTDNNQLKGEVQVLKSGRVIDRFYWKHARTKTIGLTFVQTDSTRLKASEIEQTLNEQFEFFHVQFKVQIVSFKSKEAPFIYRFNNPSTAHLRYTRQMIHARDMVLEKKKSQLGDQLVLIGVKGFIDRSIHQYMVHQKALGFVEMDSVPILTQSLRDALLTGFFNLNSHSKTEPTAEEIYGVYSFLPIYSWIDEYEEVKTNNGLVAYYLFETNSKNEIELGKNSFLSQVGRPIKKNTFSYHLQVDSVFFKYLFHIKQWGFNLLHLIGFVLLSTLWIFIGRKIRAFFKRKFKWSIVFRLMSWSFQWLTLPLLCWILFLFINLGYRWFEVEHGIIKEFEALNIEQVTDRLLLNTNPNKNEVPNLSSEIVVKQGKHYRLLQRKRVVYFETVRKTEGSVCKLVSNSDSLILPIFHVNKLALSHYIVHTLKDKRGNVIQQNVYNHLGVDLTDKLELEDPPKRILVFVNGYRPTSLGATFEENFNDIERNGLEFPNSLNRLFTTDRYNYWHPWNQIDDRFKERINPSEIYYADGHHSVSTSNHGSILRFTTVSNLYPKRCRDLKHHHCFKTKTVTSKFFGTSQKSTYKLLATKANKKGFKIRMNSGRIAGRNLFQLLNELPNTSKNDTLYIVAHSMGFAYAQGMVDHLRGKINFGGYYILAPENGKTGKVNPREWKQIWQYGSNLNSTRPDAPCLQDGIAPQSRIDGLTPKLQVFIPDKNNRFKGYFDSHFIGYYNWIFSLKKYQNGYINQN